MIRNQKEWEEMAAALKSAQSERDALAAQVEMHQKNTQLIADLNVFCQTRRIGRWGGSVSTSIKTTIDALMVNIAAQQVLLKCWQTWLGSSRESCDDSGVKLWDKIEEVCNNTPQQHLNEVRADAAKAAYSQGYDAGFSDCRRDPFAHTGGIRAYNYAKTIRGE